MHKCTTKYNRFQAFHISTTLYLWAILQVRMGKNLVQKKKQTVASKRNATVLTFTLFLAIFALAMIHLHPTDNRTKWDLTVPALNLHTVQDYYYDSHNGFFASYPFIGESTFDDATKDIVKEAKNALLSEVEQNRTANSHANLHISYKLHYYNDAYISLSFIIHQAVDAKNTEQEKTILYDRKEKEIVELKNVFKKDSDYVTILSASARKALKKQLGDQYDKERVRRATEPDEKNFHAFYIDKKRVLVLAFAPGSVADPALGVITVAISGEDIRDIIASTYAKNLIIIPKAAKPKEEEKKKEEKPTPTPAANLTPVPVPQADSSGVDCAIAKCLALTFDDGPGGPTGEMLDILAAHNARGTFFVLGVQAERHPGMISRIQNSGHVIGNHTYDHPNLEQLSVTDAQGQIGRTSDIIEGITGVRPGIARAPYGAMSTALSQAINIPFIGWSVDPQDWLTRDAAQVCDAIVNGAHPGGIVLVHDIHASSVEATRCAVPQLIQRGFTLVTVPQLLGFSNTAPAAIYSSR